MALAEVSVFSHPQPIIFSTGSQTLIIALGTNFNELDGVTAKDFLDKPAAVAVTSVIDQDGNNIGTDINSDTLAGTYTVTYTAIDSAGVPSNPLIRTITVGSGGGAGNQPPPGNPPNPPDPPVIQ